MSFTLPMNQSGQPTTIWNNGQQMAVIPMNQQQSQSVQPAMPSLGAPQTPEPSPNFLPARLVQSPEQILAKDVPMDGSVSLFLMQDLSCILARQWNAKGTIDEVRFIREVPQQSAETQSGDALSEIKERLSNIEGLLSTQRPYSKPRPKKPGVYKQNQNINKGGVGNGSESIG